MILLMEISQIEMSPINDGGELLLACYRSLVNYPYEIIWQASKVIVCHDTEVIITCEDRKAVKENDYHAIICTNQNFLGSKLICDRLISEVNFFSFTDLGISAEEYDEILNGSKENFFNLNISLLKEVINNDTVVYSACQLNNANLRIIEGLNPARGYLASLLGPHFYENRFLEVENGREYLEFYSKIEKEIKKYYILRDSVFRGEDYYSCINKIVDCFINPDDSESDNERLLYQLCRSYQNIKSGKLKKVLLCRGDRHISEHIIKNLNSKVGPFLYWDFSREDIHLEINSSFNGVVVDVHSHLRPDNSVQLSHFLSSEALRDKLVIIVQNGFLPDGIFSDYSLIEIPNIFQVKDKLAKIFFYFVKSYGLLDRYDEIYKVIYNLQESRELNRVFYYIPSIEVLESLVENLSATLDDPLKYFKNPSFWYELYKFIEKRYSRSFDILSRQDIPVSRTMPPPDVPKENSSLLPEPKTNTEPKSFQIEFELDTEVPRRAGWTITIRENEDSEPIIYNDIKFDKLAVLYILYIYKKCYSAVNKIDAYKLKEDVLNWKEDLKARLMKGDIQTAEGKNAVISTLKIPVSKAKNASNKRTSNDSHSIQEAIRVFIKKEGFEKLEPILDHLHIEPERCYFSEKSIKRKKNTLVIIKTKDNSLPMFPAV